MGEGDDGVFTVFLFTVEGFERPFGSPGSFAIPAIFEAGDGLFIEKIEKFDFRTVQLMIIFENMQHVMYTFTHPNRVKVFYKDLQHRA